mmetsp:Transcript_5243/g.7360  ORF Transcript_5243/g.7360 Transcript_5243/m.7360 type:complete len:342 (-) Transcript_5243:493-1518(-)
MGKIAGICFIFFAFLVGYLIQFEEKQNERIQTSWMRAAETNMSQTIKDWEAQGKYLEIQGKRIYVQDIVLSSNATGSETLLILHGFPTCSFDFRAAVRGGNLDKRFKRIVLFDQIGYGLSEKPANYSYSIFEQADIALELWRKLGVKEAHLLAHDMGDSVATEILARRDKELLPSWAAKLLSVTFCNGGMHIEHSNFRISQVLLRIPIISSVVASIESETVFKSQILSTTSAKGVSEEELQYWFELSVHNHGVRRLPQVITYLEDRYRMQGSWIQSLSRLDIPCHILWGKADSVAPSEIAAKLATEIPNAKLTWLEAGHYAMAEDTTEWVNAALSFYENIK